MVHAGRLLLTALHVPLRHDMYVAAAGCYTLWAVARLLGWMRSVTTSPNMAGVKPMQRKRLIVTVRSCSHHTLPRSTPRCHAVKRLQHAMPLQLFGTPYCMH